MKPRIKHHRWPSVSGRSEAVPYSLDVTTLPPIEYQRLRAQIATHTGHWSTFVRRGVGHAGTRDNWMLNFGGEDDHSCYWLLKYCENYGYGSPVIRTLIDRAVRS